VHLGTFPSREIAAQVRLRAVVLKGQHYGIDDHALKAKLRADLPDCFRKFPPPVATTPEEEAYTYRLMACFALGLLDIAEGTTLRSFLAERLNCDPMHITKKIQGKSIIRRRSFAADFPFPDPHLHMQKVKLDLEQLRTRFIDKLLAPEDKENGDMPEASHAAEVATSSLRKRKRENFVEMKLPVKNVAAPTVPVNYSESHTNWDVDLHEALVNVLSDECVSHTTNDNALCPEAKLQHECSGGTVRASCNGKRPTAQLNYDTDELIYVHASITLAAKHVGKMAYNNISRCCRGKATSAYGYKWRWATSAEFNHAERFNSPAPYVPPKLKGRFEVV
jgi:hypothetical protein